MNYRIFLMSILGFSFILFSLISNGEEKGEISSALEYLKTYKFGMGVAPLNPIVEAIKTTQNDPAKQEELSRRLMDVFSEATIDGKRFIVRQLVIVGTPSIVPKLAPFLEKEETVDLACRVLEQIPGKEATQALLDALNKTHSDSLKVAVINSLGRRRDEVAVPTLQKYLDSSVEEVRDSALFALSEIPSPKSAEVLWNWGRDKLSSGDEKIIENLLKVANNVSKISEGKEISISIYEAVYANPKTSGVSKVNALQGLMELKGKEMLPVLEKNILFGDRILSYASVDLLKKRVVSDEEVSEVINSVLPKSSSALQLALLEVITARRLKLTLPRVLEMLNSTSLEVKLMAIEALGEVGDVGSANTLMGLALSEGKEVSECAKDALLKISSSGITEFLVDKAKSGSEAERRLAVKLIGDRREVQAKPMLLECIEKGDEVVLSEALDSISIIGEEDDLSTLFDRVSKDVGGASRYMPAIISILSRVGDEARRVGYITDRLNKAKNNDERKVYIELLGNLKTPEGTQILKGMVDKEKDLLNVVVKALGNSEDVEALKFLLSKLSELRSDDLRYTAVSSCLNILRGDVPLVEFEKCAYYIDLWKFSGGRAILQRNILGNISKLNRVEALNFVEGIQPTEDIKNDWQTARLNLAKNLVFSYPERCITILESNIGGLKDKQREEVSVVLNGAKNRGNFLCAWSVSGPYQMDDYSAERLFKEVSLPPETDPASVRDWRVLPMKVRGDGLIYGDLFEQLGGGVECVAYVACKINCESPSKARLLLGSNDGIKVWLNGKLIHSSPNGRVMTPDEDKVEVNLEKNNVLLMGVYNQGGAWEFTAKLDGLDYNTVKVEPY